MRTTDIARVLFVAALVCGSASLAQTVQTAASGSLSRPEGPCDIYEAAGAPCVAAHSTTRALYRSYDGPLYQVLRQSDGTMLDIGVVKPSTSPPDPGGYADASAQETFCANTYCWISRIYDQSPKHNDLSQAPQGGFSGPAMGGYNSLPLADMAPINLMGHKVYGVFIEPGMGLRIDDAKGTAVDDQAEGQYWVINGLHYNSGCCFDYGNAEIDSRDDDNGTMETAYYGDNTGWIHGNPPGPWVMTDQENNLVGCVVTDGSRLCPHLPDIKWRFVTAMAKGEPHRWTSMGGDSQKGSLAVMFDGQRVNSSYDPMRKQGAILLGNGGDNSNSSQGTFYEGAMTASGTFPSDATDQLIQANIVASGYAEQRLSLTPVPSPHAPGLQTFSPGLAGQSTVTFTNTMSSPVKSLKLSLSAPDKEWMVLLQGSRQTSKIFEDAIGPGGSVSATFTVTPGPASFHGDLVAAASWTDGTSGVKQTETAREKVRSAAPIKINEFRIGSGSAGNSTNSFIELYNAGTTEVDLSNWTLTERPAQQTIVSSIRIPPGAKLIAKSFYLLGLANSGLAIPAQVGDATVSVRSTTGISVGDTVTVGTGNDVESRKIITVGTAASDTTTMWLPLPDGPLTLAPGSTNIPVQSTAGFKIGEKLALGYGGSTPSFANGIEQFEIATVTAVGEPGTQAYLALEAPAGATNLKVTSLQNISVGDKIRLDIDSVDHGIETVTVAHVGTSAYQTNLTSDVESGAEHIKVRRAEGFAAGDRITIGTPATREVVTVTSVENARQAGTEIAFTPALSSKHGHDEWAVSPGTGLDLAAPLRFKHAANLPFSDRGTGITFQPASRFVHLSNEPIQALGTGITLDRPLTMKHDINSVVSDIKVTTAGYQGPLAPNQWFGGPELTTRSPSFGRIITIREGSMVLRDSSGVVADSLNYGGLADPWAAEGYQGKSGPHDGGCFVASPDFISGSGPAAGPASINRSAGRFPDGADTDNNCADFVIQTATTLPTGSSAKSLTIKVASVAGFHSGQKIVVDAGANREVALIKEVGTSGSTTLSKDTAAGSRSLSVASALGFEPGQIVTVGSGAETENITVASVSRFDGYTMTTTAPLQTSHTAGSQVSSTGLTLASALNQSHMPGASVTVNGPTPGTPNRLETESAEVPAP